MAELLNRRDTLAFTAGLADPSGDETPICRVNFEDFYQVWSRQSVHSKPCYRALPEAPSQSDGWSGGSCVKTHSSESNLLSVVCRVMLRDRRIAQDGEFRLVELS